MTFFHWFWIFNAAVVILLVVNDRKRPEKTLAWIFILLLLPVVGILFYFFLGIEWKKYRLSSEIKVSKYLKERYHNSKYKLPEGNQLVDFLYNRNDSVLFKRNDVEIFFDGKELFEDIKDEIKKARHHIHMEYFIWQNDKLGNEIKDLLIQKAGEGIVIRIIIDKVGSGGIDKKFEDEMKNAGIELLFYSYFLRPFLKIFNLQLNNRDHRKLIIIDGNIGYIGGYNIGDEYLGKGKLGYWRDTHLKIKGDYVYSLQAVFSDDFYRTMKVENIPDAFDGKYEKYFPAVSEKMNDVPLQTAKSGPRSISPSIMQAVVKLIESAKDHIYIITPYFVPTESITNALVTAAYSGVDIRIIFPGKPDHPGVYNASQTYLNEVIGHGIKIYFYTPDAFIHAKSLTIDGKIGTVGTANMDVRSYKLNYEINTVIYDEKVIKKIEDQFEKDLSKSKLISDDYFDKLPFYVKIWQSVMRIFSGMY